MYYLGSLVHFVRTPVHPVGGPVHLVEGQVHLLGVQCFLITNNLEIKVCLKNKHFGEIKLKMVFEQSEKI